MRRHRPEPLAVADEIGDRQVLVAHHHDIVVEPRLVDLAPFVRGHRLDVDAADLDTDLRTHLADLEHRAFSLDLGSLSQAYCRASQLNPVNSQLAMAAIRLCKRGVGSHPLDLRLLTGGSPPDIPVICRLLTGDNRHPT